jgi:3-(methylthio)propanoyl-CoA dehydrogenase
MSYEAPLREMRFVLEELAGLRQLQQLPDFEEASDDTVDAVLQECARLTSEVIAPLNASGDRQPSSWTDGNVTMSPGFRAAFRSFAEGGWQGLQHSSRFGGQGLPKLVATPCQEMLQAANLSFALCPLLTDGTIEALMTAGSERQQSVYVPRLIDGSWTGTMNLTEPQAGSDLAQVRTRAVPQADGSYRLFGQKIFITYGEHDLSENIIHMVLARTPDAPEGVKGLSLFIVPKYVIGPDGRRGARNDVYCASIEHKLGIKASPTAVLIYGEGHGQVGNGAVAEIIGGPNRGLEYMFIMMNAARFAVGVQGVGVAERAYQQAAQFARQRLQSRAVQGSSGPVPIVEHPDVRRMLMLMRSQTQAARAVAYMAAAQCDLAHAHPDADVRARAQAMYEYLVPIVKGGSTEMAVEVASLGIQVHGGMGYIEETGAAQHYRDARILPIYEGTTAIQANDLLTRKTARDAGAVARSLIVQMRETAVRLKQRGGADFNAIHGHLVAGIDGYERVVDYLVRAIGSDIRGAFSGAVPYLRMAATVLGGWQLARSALVADAAIAAGSSDVPFLRTKVPTARFFAEQVLSQAPGVAGAVLSGGAGALDPTAEDF